MASFQIHLAVAKVYFENHTIKNCQEFIKGILDPDFAIDKDISHYSDSNRGTTLKSHLESKVNIKKYLIENKINSDYKKGEFLHLLTDYEFFHHFFEEEYIKNISYDDYCKDLYYSYVETNQLLKELYPLSLEEFQERIDYEIEKNQKEKESNNYIGNNILPKDKLNKFINHLGTINLEEARKEIINL